MQSNIKKYFKLSFENNWWNLEKFQVYRLEYTIIRKVVLQDEFYAFGGVLY